MKQRLAAQLALLTVSVSSVVVCAHVALAHGGAYRGPPGELPPGAHPPPDVPPPPPDSGVQHPDPRDGSGPTVRPIRREHSSGQPLSDWTFWWNLNRETFIATRPALLRARAREKTLRRTASGAQSPSSPASPLDERLDALARPALLELATSRELNFDIQSAAVLALAKLGSDSTFATAKALLFVPDSKGTKRRFHKVAHESAALAIGVAQQDTPAARAYLQKLIGAPPERRSYARPFAALALGLLAHKTDDSGAVADALFNVLAGKERREDMKPCALLALGLLGDARNVPRLLELLQVKEPASEGTTSLTTLERAFVIDALGRIGQPGLPDSSDSSESTEVLDVIEQLLQRDRSMKVSTAIPASAATALGRLAPLVSHERQVAVLQTLVAFVRQPGKRRLTSRGQGVMAIAQIGHTATTSSAVRWQVIDVLRGMLQASTLPRDLRAHAGLGLGLIARAQRALNLPVPEGALLSPLVAAFMSEKHARTRGAHAVALGLAQQVSALGAFERVLQDRTLPTILRGSCVLAIGLLGSERGRGAVRTCLTRETDGEIRIQALYATGMIGDETFVDPVMTILHSVESPYVMGAAVTALGQIGTASCVEKLIETARDKHQRKPDLTRAMAVAALGAMGDPLRRSTLSRITARLNSLYLSPALRELVTLL